MPSFPFEVKTVRGRNRHWKNQSMGNEDNDEIILSKKAKRRDVV